MDLYSLVPDILSQDEDPADYVPTDGKEGWEPAGCVISWVKSRFFDEILRWASFPPVYYTDSVDR